jgi:hypothetical protein
VRLPLAARRTASGVSCGQLRWRSQRQRHQAQKAPDPCAHDPDPRSKAVRSHWIGSGPHQVSSRPPITRSREREYHDLDPGPGLTRVLALTVAPPPPPPLGQGSNAAAWLIVRDIGQRAERDVRALSRAPSAFIVERTRRLSTLLKDDVPPQHLLCSVLSTGRRRRGHPADCAPVQSVVETVCPCCAVRCTHPLYEKLPPTRRGYVDLGCQTA